MSEIQKLLEPADLQNLLSEPNILIVDLCNDDLFSRKHIPGAVHVSVKELMNGGQPWPNKLPSPPQLSALFSRLGLTDDTHVVVYDDEGGGWAGRFIWTLDVIGHHKWSYLNGGFVAWHNEGFPMADEIPAPKALENEVKVNLDALVTTEEIMSHLEAGDLQIWDARSPAEYRGEKVMSDKAGHIPGAINCEWTSLIDNRRNMRIREDALEHLTQLGILTDKPTVTHCQSHHRSGFTYMLGQILGFKNLRAYDGSWWEWGNRPDTPVEL